MVESRWKTPVGKRGPLNVNGRCETHRGRDGAEEEPDGRGDGGGGTARGLRIGGWNIHGWRRNRGEALRAIEELGLDVLVVSEPWLKGAGRVCGFKWLEYVEAGGRRAKVVMLVRNGVEAVLMKGSTRRMVWVKLCDKNNKGDVLVIGGVYGYCNGKGGRKGREWWGQLEAMIERGKSYGKVMVIGDLNARIGKDGGPNGEEKKNENGKRMMRVVDRQSMWATLVINVLESGRECRVHLEV